MSLKQGRSHMMHTLIYWPSQKALPREQPILSPTKDCVVYWIYLYVTYAWVKAMFKRRKNYFAKRWGEESIGPLWGEL